MQSLNVLIFCTYVNISVFFMSVRKYMSFVYICNFFPIMNKIVTSLIKNMSLLCR